MMQFDQAIKFLEMVCNDLLPKIEEESARSATKGVMLQAFQTLNKNNESLDALLEENKEQGERANEAEERAANVEKANKELDARCLFLERKLDELETLHRNTADLLSEALKKIDYYENPPDHSEDDGIGNGEG